MFAIGIRYLNGWAMAAADGAKKEVAEWPPHPDRVFMALACSHFETERLPSERAALEWLELLPAPQIAASHSHQRETVTHFVPVNDAACGQSGNIAKLVGNPDTELGKLKDAGLTLMPEMRSRQPRQFPVAIPECDRVYLIWPEARPDDTQREALAGLCAKVVRIGHSASFTQLWIEDQPPAANWVPDDLALHRWRVPSAGRLTLLEREFREVEREAWQSARAAVTLLQERHQTASGKGAANKLAKQQLKAELDATLARAQTLDDVLPQPRRPLAGVWQGYGPPPKAAPQEIWSGNVFAPDILVLRQISGTRLGLESTLLLTQALRKALMSDLGNRRKQAIPAWLSGHDAEGKPSREPHLAFFPLANVGHPNYADGRIMGVGLALPRDIPRTAISDALEAILYFDQYGEPKPIHVYEGHPFDLELALDLRSDPPFSLQLERACLGPAEEGHCEWATVTPIALDRHFDGPRKWDEAESMVADSCERIGLPRPLAVSLFSTSLVRGAPKRMPPLLRKDGSRRHHVHALLRFPHSVRGPVLIGAGRFRGYGLCRPRNPGDGP